MQLPKICSGLLLRLRYAYHRFITRDVRTAEACRWFLADGNEKYLFSHEGLSSGSCVVEVGGYVGVFSKEMVDRYGCRLHVLEPVPQFCRQLRQTLGMRPNVSIYEFGLAAASGKMTMSLAGDASSVFVGGEPEEVRVDMVAVADFFQNHCPGVVDLLTVNIEGGEYDLIDALYASGILPRIKKVMVQFHNFVPDANSRRDRALGLLAETHAVGVSFPFVWESFILKP